jgi:hypothetical protein
MKAVVVDTNVCIVANGVDTHATLSCIRACITALEDARKSIVVIDDRYLIIDEYRRYLSASGQPNVGDAFFKWLWDNHCNDLHCQRVAITPREDPKRRFEEFPPDPDLAGFDPSDQKFVAAAIASGLRPEVLNASDDDWWNYRAALAAHGVSITFLCPELMATRSDG